MGKLKKMVSLVTACVLVFGCVSTGFSVDVDALEIQYAMSQTQDRTSYYSRDFVLTGNYADDVLAVARAQLGKTTSELNYSEAWCANFSNDCARLTGMPDNIIPYNYGLRASCMFMYNYMLSDCGAKVIEDLDDVRPGDYVFYYCPASNFYLHVGIVENHDYYIEGNYNKMVREMPFNYNYSCYMHKGAGYDFDSGHVKRLYLRPNYPEPPKEYTSTEPEDYSDNVPTRVLKYKEPVTSCGFDVCWVQAILFKLGYLSEVTGEYNQNTVTAVRSFQSDHNMEETGEVNETVVYVMKSAYDYTFNPVCRNFKADKDTYYIDQQVTLSADINNADTYFVAVRDSEDNEVKHFENTSVCTFNASDIGVGSFTAEVYMTNNYKSVYSNVVSFRVEDPYPAATQVRVEPGTGFKSTSITWNETKNSEFYDLYIKNKRTGENVLTRNDLSELYYNLLLPEGDYTAYVVSKNSLFNAESTPVDFKVGKGTAVDLGDSFYAEISFNERLVSYQHEKNLVALNSESKNYNNVWYFVKNKNSSSYSIKCCENGNALTAFDIDKISCTEFKDQMSQRWFVAQGRSGYYLIPTNRKETTLCSYNDSLVLRGSQNEFGEAFEITKVDPVHKYILTEVTGASCTEDGHAVYKCVACDDGFEKTIEAAGHSYTAAGVSDGKIVYTCEYCGDSYVSDEAAPVETPDTPDSPDQAKPDDRTAVLPREIISQRFLIGDVDGDGKISASDSLLITRASVGLENLTDFGMVIADVDCDGKITSADGLQVLREVVHLYTGTKVRDVIVIETNMNIAVIDDNDDGKKKKSE